ncbi:hypothetical protein KUTeg_023663 [Tegillarca granosa]|uniref:Uncharacterized protein n=1 Tax=Tegillarca granosa TaxID=220873 RepID=A0ABQ9E2B1_TEGGR|nr:hypothetical protein KUTeg_023663 [Tegillarca granosa]
MNSYNEMQQPINMLMERKLTEDVYLLMLNEGEPSKDGNLAVLEVDWVEPGKVDLMKTQGSLVETNTGADEDRKRSKRSRSRDRKRSRSKERKRGRRSRSRDRKRSRDREDRRPEEGGGGDADYNEEGEICIKSEPNRPGYGEENLQNYNGNEEQYNDGNEGYENQDQAEPVDG